MSGITESEIEDTVSGYVQRLFDTCKVHSRPSREEVKTEMIKAVKSAIKKNNEAISRKPKQTFY